MQNACFWRNAVVIVKPATIVRWHRDGWRLFWRMKSRPGRPPIPRELRLLIRRMGQENPLWGEERIAIFLFNRSRPVSCVSRRDFAEHTCPTRRSATWSMVIAGITNN